MSHISDSNTKTEDYQMRMEEAMKAMAAGRVVDVSRVTGSTTSGAGKAAGVVPGSKVERQVSLG